MNESDFRREMLDRSLPYLAGADFRNKTIGIAGCGGVGGIVATTLARMGFGGFHLADPGRFDKPDMNRQIGASTVTLDCNKSGIYRELIHDINPFARVKVWKEGIQEHTVDAFLEGVDFLVDCLDVSVPPSLRGRMFTLARKNGIVAVTAPVLSFGTLVLCSHPDSMSMEPYLKVLEGVGREGRLPASLRKIFNPRNLDCMEEWFRTRRTKVPSIAVAPLVAASIVCTEAVSGEVYLPRLYAVDLIERRFEIVTFSSLFPDHDENGVSLPGAAARVRP